MYEKPMLKFFRLNASTKKPNNNNKKIASNRKPNIKRISCRTKHENKKKNHVTKSSISFSRNRKNEKKN